MMNYLISEPPNPVCRKYHAGALYKRVWPTRMVTAFFEAARAEHPEIRFYDNGPRWGSNCVAHFLTSEGVGATVFAYSKGSILIEIWSVDLTPDEMARLYASGARIPLLRAAGREMYLEATPGGRSFGLRFRDLEQDALDAQGGGRVVQTKRNKTRQTLRSAA